MRALTALFVLLVIVPGAVLGWFGLRYAAQLEDLAMAAAQRELRVAGRQLVRQVSQACETESTLLGNLAKDAANRFARRLPFEPAGLLFREVHSASRGPGPYSELLILDARGRVLFPAPARPLPFPREWSDRVKDAAHLEYAQGDAAAAAALWDGWGNRTESPTLRARAWTMAERTRVRHGIDRPEEAADRLLSLPAAALRTAAPMIGGVLERSDRGRAWLGRQAEEGWLEAMPGVVRSDHPLPGDGRHSSPSPREQWSLRNDPQAMFWKTAPLPGGASLAVGIPIEPARYVPATFRGFDIRLGEGPVVLDLFGTPFRVRIEHRDIAAIDAAGTRRRVWGAVGILALLLLMATGLVLVRRTLRRERAARQLRDDFIANVSHDLRTPLTSLRMYSEMLGDAGIEDEQRARYARVAEAEGARLSALVEDLLDFSALERGTRRLEPEPVDLGSLARALVEAWRPLAEQQGVTLEATGEGQALADPIATGRIVTNLLQNALKHAAPSRVRLRAGPGPRIRVGDNGTGIDPEQRRRLFSRFQSGAQGTGLGLALSRELAHAMAGELRLEPGTEETVFCLSLAEVPEMTP